jgi:hypothetical protein
MTYLSQEGSALMAMRRRPSARLLVLDRAGRVLLFRFVYKEGASNTTPLPARVFANEGICQFLFLKADSPCAVSYADRAGKYQGQTGVTLPRMETKIKRRAKA